ncbi:hypothetical protein [Mesorhizobium sp. Root157]|uniref:hypothetical protein n=1 Tax=Mesorhizobium sp. Root157 TaxID=1736477 RepID=UPI001FCD56D7|nr:hypothetical protein [Mesorhizobium sp. Root157]
MKFIGITDKRHARLAWLAPLAVSGLALSGCMSSPTYGTDKTAMEQLTEDVSGAISLKPPPREKIDYTPRPTLVKPAAGQKGTLPPPQDNIVQTASAQWPESPEQRRARIRATATANQDNPLFEPEVINDVSVQKPSNGPREGDDDFNPARAAYTNKSAREEVKRRLIETKQGNPTQRKFLSEPPLDYRVAASTAPQNDIGEDEYKKERRLKREASKGGGLFGWWPW